MTADPMPAGPGGLAAPAVPTLPTPNLLSRVVGAVQGVLFCGLLLLGFVLPITLILVGLARG